MQMSKSREKKLFHYSTKTPFLQRASFIFVVLMIVFSLLFAFSYGIYLVTHLDKGQNSIEEEIIVVVTLFGYCAIILPIAIILIPKIFRKETFIEEYTVYSDEMIYKKIDLNEKKTEVQRIAFADIDWSLIGNLSYYVPGNVHVSGHYKNQVIFILKYHEQYHILDVKKEKEFKKWTAYLNDLAIPIYYHPYDMTAAKTHQYTADFDAIKKVPLEESSAKKPIFHTTSQEKQFPDWKPIIKEQEA